MLSDLRQQLTFRRSAILALLGFAPSACSEEGLEQPDNVSTTGEAETGGTTEVNPGATTSATAPDPSQRRGSGPSACGSSTDLGGSDETCQNGLVHRVSASLCDDNLAGLAAPALTLAFDKEPEELGCTQHAECDAQPYGYCRAVGVQIIVDFQCQYGCTVDADCAEGFACDCGPSIGTCVPAECRSDADCGEGHLCAKVPDHSSCGIPPQYVCQTATDPCAVDTDCSEGICGIANGRLECLPAPAVCGRPFLVEAGPVQASLSDANDWCAKMMRVRVEDLSRTQRQTLGAWWSHVGLLEHASIAAFARFSLQLLQLGAPLELLQASNRAMLDETLHAELAFGLAKAYLGKATGPGPLPVEGALRQTALAEIVRLVVREGCIGETVAAHEAWHALGYCKVPEVRGVLERIARDENEHSDLAWRFVRWALSVEPQLIDVVFAECELVASELPTSCAARLNTSCDEPLDAKWLEQGVLSPLESQRVYCAVVEQVVLPCARALLATRAAA